MKQKSFHINSDSKSICIDAIIFHWKYIVIPLQSFVFSQVLYTRTYTLIDTRQEYFSFSVHFIISPWSIDSSWNSESYYVAAAYSIYLHVY